MGEENQRRIDETVELTREADQHVAVVRRGRREALRRATDTTRCGDAA
jgi:hypothetical protein